MAKNKREFDEGLIFTITNYIFWFLMGNLYFALVNIPLVFILLIILSNGINTLPAGFAVITFICFIPIGPAATALFSVMGKLIREKDINITKDFFKAYKTNFKQSLFLWTLELILIALLFIDTRFLLSGNYPFIFTMILYSIIVFVFLAGLYMLPIQSRFYLKSKDIMKLSAYYFFKKLNITLLNLSILIFAGIILFNISSFFILFISSTVCYLIMYIEQKMLLQIEENLKEQVL